MDSSRRPTWQAEYKVSEGKGTFTVPGTSTNDCPVASITPQSFELVQIFARSKQIGGESGTVTLFGPDLRNWPSKIADAFMLMETERVKTDSARMDAETERRNGPERN